MKSVSRDGKTIRIWCRHFVGVTSGGKCEKDVVYKEQSWFGGGQHWPCHGEECERCPTYEPHTKEEIAERDKVIEESIRRITIVHPAIQAESLKLGFEQGKKGVGGNMECPVCKERLSFSRSSYNGYIHAKCSKDGCVSFME